MKHYAIHFTVRGIAKIECVKGYSSNDAIRALLAGYSMRDKRFFKLGKIETINLGVRQ